jgi:elongation factor Ts
MSNIDLIKSIRTRTNLSYKDITKAINELNSTDEDKIISYLREQGVLKAQARQDRETNQGGIFSYIHEGQLGVLVEIKCETDFVARSDSFKAFGKNIALHIAASNPKFVNKEQIDETFINSELTIAREQMLNEGKTEEIIEKILLGKKNSIEKEYVLLAQPYLKDPSVTVESYIASVSHETGEKIVVSRFQLYSLNA